ELWRGPALAEFADYPFAREETPRLDELRLEATEDYHDARLALGGGADSILALERLVDAHPYRERLPGQPMLALYRAGRQAEALERYREGRRLLVDEVGVEPGPQLRELERAILQHHPALGALSRPQAPTEQPGQTPPTRGRRHFAAAVVVLLVLPAAAIAAAALATRGGGKGLGSPPPPSLSLLATP